MKVILHKFIYHFFKELCSYIEDYLLSVVTVIVVISLAMTDVATTGYTTSDHAYGYIPHLMVGVVPPTYPCLTTPQTRSHKHFARLIGTHKTRHKTFHWNAS